MKHALIVVVGLAMVAGALLVGCQPMDGTEKKTTREKLLGTWETVDGGVTGRFTFNSDGTLVISATFEGETATGDGGWFVNDQDVLTYTFLLPRQPTVTRVRHITVLTETKLCLTDADNSEGFAPKTDCWTRV